MRSSSEKGLTVLDAVITLCLIGILIGVVIPYYQRLAVDAQKVALKTGLANIRTSIRLFRILNNRNPVNLKELVEKKAMLPARGGPDKYTGSLFLKESFLMEFAVDRNGNIIDAFGNPFDYDTVKGEVKATTKGFENW
jgi:competence protein ComGC